MAGTPFAGSILPNLSSTVTKGMSVRRFILEGASLRACTENHWDPRCGCPGARNSGDRTRHQDVTPSLHSPEWWQAPSCFTRKLSRPERPAKSCSAFVTCPDDNLRSARACKGKCLAFPKRKGRWPDWRSRTNKGFSACAQCYWHSKFSPSRSPADRS